MLTCFCGDPINVVIQCLVDDSGDVWRDMFTSPTISEVIQSTLESSKPDTRLTGKVYHSVDEIVGDMDIPAYILDKMQKDGFLDAMRSIEREGEGDKE